MKQRLINTGLITLSLLAFNVFANESDQSHAQKVDQLQKDIEILQLQAKVAEINKSIKTDQGSSVAGQATKSSSSSQMTKKRNKRAPSKLYVLRIFGVKGALKANILYQGQAIVATIGDKIGEYVIQAIDIDGVTATRKGKRAVFGLSLVKKAFADSMKKAPQTIPLNLPLPPQTR